MVEKLILKNFHNMAQECLKISLENCTYRGEGNANLVVLLSIPEGEDRIVRLVKKELDSADISNSSSVLQKLENIVAVMKNVMAPLLGNGLVHSPEIAWLSAEQIKTINMAVSIHRPLFRCHKAVEETNSPVLILPDSCSFPKMILKYCVDSPIISVEIKPKQGFVENLIAPGKPVCNFCMMQYYKLEKQSISSRSGYCPINLFSGCPKEMQQAIQELFKAPQNNLRIFKDQELMYSGEKKTDLSIIFHEFFGQCSEEVYISKFSALLIQLLLTPLNSIKESVNLPVVDRIELKCTNSVIHCSHANHSHKLPENCILERVLKLQSLAALNIDAIVTFYECLRQIKLSDKQSRIGIHLQNRIPQFIGHESKMPFESKLQFMSRKVWEFLLAATLKDCSLMITLKYIGCDSNFHNAITNIAKESIVVADDGNHYLYSITVIDLDGKPINKVERVYNARKDLRAAYLNGIKMHEHLND